MLQSDSDFILIVDDNPTNLAVLSQALKSAGLKVRVAADGESAIALVMSKLPTLILLDVQMPGIDGFETCRRLKADIQTKNIPIIFTTALADTENKVKGLSIGAVDYITKPFEESEVIARVNVHLQLHYLTEELARKNHQLNDFNGELERQVSQRTDELNQAQVHLVQQEKLSALGELVAGIAHEFNNPIGCIVNNIDPAQTYIDNLSNAINLYRSQLPDPDNTIAQRLEALDLDFILEDLPKVLRSISLSSDRIRDISTSLRNFARADQDSQQPIDLHESIDSTLLILGHRLKSVGDRPEIKIIKQYGDLPAVSCYPGQLNQVLMNLLANAIDAIDESHQNGEISDLEIQLKTSIQAEFIAICISNNGPVIPRELHDRLFEPRFTTKKVGKGTGLGLSISRQIIVDRHHGQLQFDPDRTEGAAFTILLPLQAR
jgi:signal transduction histidine kinase